MGIYDFYFRWLKPQLSSSKVLKKQLPAVSSFSIDGNGIIHTNAQLVFAYGEAFVNKHGTEKGSFLKEQRKKFIKNLSIQQLEEQLFTSIGQHIQTLVTAVNPLEYFFFAIDGAAPQAKMTQQRSRRFKNVSKGPADETTLDSLGQNVIKPEDDVILFDPNCISPGTDFMVRLDEYLRNFLERNINNLAKVILYSSHLSPGEGEHKIMDYFRLGRITGNKAHVFYGMDTDLILLSMALNVNNILLWREGADDILDIDALKFLISEKMGQSPSAPDDFIVIMNLFGNDFLPVQPSLDDFSHSIDQVLKIYEYLYKNYQITFVSRGPNGIKLDLNKFTYLLFQLYNHESRLLSYEASPARFNPGRGPQDFIKRDSYNYAQTVQHEDGSTEASNFDYDKFRTYWYYNELYPRGDPDLIKRILGDNALDITPNAIEEMVKSYLNGLNFVFEYYFNGANNINLKWYYNYYHTPLLYDIYNYINTTENWINTINEYIAPTSNLFANVMQQLLSILPPQSVDLIPPEFRWLLTDVTSPLIDYYPIDFIVDYELKDKLYKGIPILPFIDPNRVIEAISTMRFDKDRFSYLQLPSSLELRRDPIIEEIICNSRQFRAQITSRGRGSRGRGTFTRGRGGDRGRSISKRTWSGDREMDNSQESNIPIVPPNPQIRGVFIPTYNINQGPYEVKNDLSFTLPNYNQQ